MSHDVTALWVIPLFSAAVIYGLNLRTKGVVGLPTWFSHTALLMTYAKMVALGLGRVISIQHNAFAIPTGRRCIARYPDFVNGVLRPMLISIQ